MGENGELTVKDHLAALGYDESWMVTLGEMIVEFTGNDVAIAASRAMDLASNKRFGKSVGYLLKGYLAMCEELDNGHDLSPNQRETIRQILKGMNDKVKVYFTDKKFR